MLLLVSYLSPLLVPLATVATIATLALPVTPAALAAMPDAPLPATVSHPAAVVAGSAVDPEHTGSARPAAPLATPEADSGKGLSVAHRFAWPLSPRPAVRRGFERPPGQWSRGHRGADLVSTVGQPVLSAGDGAVAFSGMVAGRGVITVRHKGGMRTTYEPVTGQLSSGTLVHRGTRIGVLSAVPGHCVPLVCLHWGAILGRTYQDPLALLGFGRPILLPLG